MEPHQSRFQWIEADDPNNKFGIRFIDCRPITQTFTTTTESMEIADSYVRLRSSSGIEYQEEDINDYTKLNISLIYPLKNYEEGALYKSPKMEYKWDIYLYNDVIIFTRSWGGQLVYMVPITLQNDELHISEVHATPGNAKLGLDYVMKEIDFLIKSHLFNITVPHPIAPHLKEEDDEIIALSAFANWGRLGSFGSFEDTSKLDLVYLSNTFKYEIKSEFKTNM
ncbi:MAG: hypothetical protein ACXAC2_10390 [Candidatus Kariarchaeaceae archaeon]